MEIRNLENKDTMLKAYYIKHVLKFKKPAITSRDTLKQKNTWYLVLKDFDKNITAFGECSTIPGLSIDNELNYEAKLKEVCAKINFYESFDFDINLNEYPSILFGIETLKKDWEQGGIRRIYDTKFYLGQSKIPINGLVWMGPIEDMKLQVKEKIEAGYNCIKIKIGALNWNEEIDLLKQIRKEYSKRDIILRVDANGAFSVPQALDKLKQLSDLHIHSIEQPIKQFQIEEMANLCEKTPLPIALDEELIGIKSVNHKEKLLEVIKPQYLILKPSLLGGLKSCDEWVVLAEKHNIGWWSTSALESNIGLNAIAQWTSTYQSNMHQGLGTGQLYLNNIDSPLKIEKGNILYDPNKNWVMNI